MKNKNETSLSSSSLVFGDVADIKTSIEKLLNRKIGNQKMNVALFQNILNAHAANEPELQNLEFDLDQRIYELMSLIAVYGVLKKNTPYPDRIKICWQKAGEKTNFEKISNGKSQSVDGVLTFFAPNKENTFLPVEIKSTMCDPGKPISTTIDSQVEDLISQKQKELGGTAQASIIAVMPYAPVNGDLSIDLERPVKRLQAIADEASLAAICLFEITQNAISVVAAVAYGKYFTPDLLNTEEWIGRMIFHY